MGKPTRITLAAICYALLMSGNTSASSPFPEGPTPPPIKGGGPGEPSVDYIQSLNILATEELLKVCDAAFYLECHTITQAQCAADLSPIISDCLEKNTGWISPDKTKESNALKYTAYSRVCVFSEHRKQLGHEHEFDTCWNAKILKRLKEIMPPVKAEP